MTTAAWPRAAIAAGGQTIPPLARPVGMEISPTMPAQRATTVVCVAVDTEGLVIVWPAGHHPATSGHIAYRGPAPAEIAHAVSDAFALLHQARHGGEGDR